MVIVDEAQQVLRAIPLGGAARFGELTLRLSHEAQVETDQLRAVRFPVTLMLRVEGRGLVALTPPRMRIGRDPSCEIPLDEPSVSAAHAELTLERDRWVLRDLESTNGLRVNGARVREALVERGDVITLGRASVRVEGAYDSESNADELVGASPAMKALRDEIARYAEAPYPVLVQGPSGAGKELVARALHRNSPHSSAPFVAVNCGALSPDVVESELFGHERGAFTGAVGRRRGLFEEAHEGTLFLDEIGELSLPLQTRLLRVLETGEVRRVGAECTTPVNVRVVCATWRDLEAMCREGTFRVDLLYRLAVLRVRVPSLQERASDLPALCQRLLARIEEECGRRRELEDRALALLSCTPWPGNVRELLAVLRRAVFLSDGKLVTAAHIQLASPEAAKFAARLDRTKRVRDDGGLGLRDLFERFDGNVSRISKVTGLARSTVRARLARGDDQLRDSALPARYDQPR